MTIEVPIPPVSTRQPRAKPAMPSFEREAQNPANESASPFNPLGEVASSEVIRARRQLIGLVVLVLLAVFGLPYLIQIDPQPIDDDVVVEVLRARAPLQPDSIQDAPPNTGNGQENLDLSVATTEKESQSVVKPIDETKISEPVKQTKNSGTKDTNKDTNKDITKDSNQKNVAATVKNSGQPPAAQKDPAKLTPAPANSVTSAGSKAISNAKGDKISVPQDTSKTSYFVQAGVFESNAKAQLLRDKIRAKKINAEIKILVQGTKNQYAVRVYGFTQRTLAETTRGQLAKSGVDSIVVKE